MKSLPLAPDPRAINVVELANEENLGRRIVKDVNWSRAPMAGAYRATVSIPMDLTNFNPELLIELLTGVELKYLTAQEFNLRTEQIVTIYIESPCHESTLKSTGSRRTDILSILDCIPTDDLEPLMMYFGFDGEAMTTTAIAQEMNLSEMAIRTRLADTIVAVRARYGCMLSQWRRNNRFKVVTNSGPKYRTWRHCSIDSGGAHSKSAQDHVDDRLYAPLAPRIEPIYRYDPASGHRYLDYWSLAWSNWRE